MVPPNVGEAVRQAMQQWYDSSDEAHKAIIRYACIGGATALIPLPVVGEVADIAIQIMMYRALNKLTGVKFSEKVLRNVGKVIVANVAGVLGGVFALLAGTAAVKFIPVLNFLGGALAAPAAGVAFYVCGKVYYEMLGGFIRNGCGEGLSEDEIVQRMKDEMVSDEQIKAMQKEAKKEMKDVNYKDFKEEAKEVVG